MSQIDTAQLLSRYFRGELTGEERRMLVEAVLADQDLYNTFAKQQVLSELLEDTDFRRKVEEIVAPERNAAAAFAERLPNLMPGWKTATAFGALAVIALVAVLFKHGFETEKQTGPRSEPTITRRLTPAPSGPPRAEEHKPPPDRNAEPVLHARAPKVFSLILVPTERGAGDENILRLSPGPQIIRLRVDIAANAYTQFAGVLETSDRKSVAACADPSIRRAQGSSSLIIESRCDSLPAGTYTITISGFNGDGPHDPVGGYSFRVVGQDSRRGLHNASGSVQDPPRKESGQPKDSQVPTPSTLITYGPLTPSSVETRHITNKERQRFSLAMAPATYASLTVTCSEGDITVSVSGPSGAPVSTGYCPRSTDSVLELPLLAEQPVTQTIDVTLTNNPVDNGSYTIAVSTPTAATEQDRQRVKGQAASERAITLQREGTAESQRKAIEAFQDALSVWHSVGDAVNEARTLLSLGEVHVALAEYQPALGRFREALKVSQDLKNRRLEAASLNNLGGVHFYLGEEQPALDALQRGFQIRSDIGDPRGLSESLNDLGVVYSALGDAERAIVYLERALGLRRNVRDIQGEATTLTSMGDAYQKLGEKEKAATVFQQSLPLLRAIADRYTEAATLNNMATLYSGLGEKDKAVSFYRQALSLEQQVGDRQGEARTIGNLCQVYHALGDNNRALTLCEESLRLCQAIKDRTQETATLNYLGQIHSELDRTETALNYFSQALSVAQTTGSKRWQGIALGNIASTHDKTGRTEIAIKFSEQSVELLRATGNLADVALALVSEGKMRGALGQKQKALDDYNEGLALSRTVGDVATQATAHYEIARVQRDGGNLEGALAEMEVALPLLESLRVKAPDSAVRASFFATVHKPYEFYIDLLMRLNAAKPGLGYELRALEATERARARFLVDRLAETVAHVRRGVDIGLADRERSLRQLIQSNSERRIRLLIEKAPTEKITATDAKISELLTLYEENESAIRHSSPQYASLTVPEPIKAHDIQNLLDENTILLEYSLGDEQSYLWAVTSSSVSAYALPRRSEIEAVAQRMYKSLAAKPNISGGVGSRTREAPDEDAELLSRIVLSPVRGLLQKRRLVVAADGVLNYVPFAALPAPLEANGSQILLDHEVVNVPSASTLIVLRKAFAKRQVDSKSVAVIADPVFDRNDPRVTRRLRPGTSPAHSTPAGAAAGDQELQRAVIETGLSNGLVLPRLAYAGREAESIYKLARPTGALKALDFDANLRLATSPELAQYRVVHFATHALLNNEHPALSGLVLSTVDKYGRPQDGFFSLQDIYNLNLPADLVVLSSCESALGKQIQGEGLIGMTRGFFYAGAPRVVASLWKVDDFATSEFMKRFYEALLVRKMTPVAALRATQMAMSKQPSFRSPYYWAGFVIQGDWR